MSRPARLSLNGGLRRALVACAAWLACALFPVAAPAQDVTLSSRDGGIEVSGTLLGYDGEFYRIRSEYGDLTLDGSGVVCSGPGCPDLAAYVARLSFSGPRILTERLMPELLRAFARSQDYALSSTTSEALTEFRLDDQDSGLTAAIFRVASVPNAEAFAHLLSGEADIVLATRPVLPDENALAVEAGLGNLAGRQQSRVIALDAIVPVVSARNPAQRLAIEDLTSILSGELADWFAISGVDAPIFIHLLSGDNVERTSLLETVLLPLGRNFSGLIQYHDSPQALLDAVARDPFALGLARLSDAGNLRVLDLTDSCSIARSADADTLKSEDYPLAAPMLLYQRGGRLPLIVREFLSFLDTPAAQIAIQQTGLTDQGMVRTVMKRQGDRLANAIRMVDTIDDLKVLQRLVSVASDYARLSLSFRFDPDSPQLDLQSRSNVRLLAGALENGTLGAREILFVGLGGNGDAKDPVALSRLRAEEVERRVINAAATLDRRSVITRSMGFGDALPLACDDHPWGRRTNQRVEVWVR